MDTTVLEPREAPARALEAAGARLMVRQADTTAFVLCTSLTDLEDLLQSGDASCVVFVLSPVRAVAVRLERSVPTQSVLDDWRDGLDAIVQLWRRNRDRICIVEMPQTSAELPAGEMRQAFEGLAAGHGLPQFHPDLLFEAFAGLALGQDLRCRTLVETLAAAQKGTGRDLIPTPALIDALMAIHRRRTETERDQQILIDILAGQVADLEQALIGTDTRCKTLTREKQALEARRRKEVGDLQGAITAIYASTSWRITGPARWVIQRVRR